MSLVLPPASPGYKTYPNSGIIVIAAGAFPGPARGSLSVITDPTAPGPTQIQDSQFAVSAAAALDSVVIDMDTVGVVSGRPYGMFLGFLANDTGSLDAHVATVLHTGTVLQPGGGSPFQTLFISGGPYGMVDGSDFYATGEVLKSGPGQQLKFRTWRKSGTGSINLDCIFLMPFGSTGLCGTAQNVFWEEVFGGSPYTVPSDGWDGGGPNGLFAAMDVHGQVADSDLNAAPDPSVILNSVNVNGGCGGISGTTAPQRMLATARVTDSTKGVGKLTAVIGDYPDQVNGHTYDVPADESVYMIDLDQDEFDPSDTSLVFAYSLWSPVSGQHTRASEGFVYEVDPAPGGAPINVIYRIDS